MWWTYTQNEDPMLVTLFVADGNLGSLKEYEGLPIWEYAALTAGAKFRWFPLLRSIGLTIGDVKKKTNVEEAEDNIGFPVIDIAGWEPGEGQDGAYVRVLTTKSKYQGEWRTKVGKWLDWEEPDDDGGVGADEEGDEPEEPETPKRGRGPRTAPKATADEATPRSARRSAGRGAGSKAAPAGKKAASGRGRGRSAAAEDEPPF
jgi:hypothetical protein